MNPVVMYPTETTLSPEQATPEFLGGKGYGLHKMQKAGIPVPPALVLPTALCDTYYANPVKFAENVRLRLDGLRTHMTGKFGFMPLLSVRSGARVSMPGMMDTVLNVGLDNDTLPEWKKRLGEKCAMDSYSRLIEMFGSVVRGLDREAFAGQTAMARLQTYKKLTGEDFPNADDQIVEAVCAVFRSWHNERAKVYRAANDIPEDWGTAVVLQAMVFGNLNDQSATGVLFTRNPDTGENTVVGEFLINAQGEDVVAGTETPMPLSKMYEWNKEVAQELLTLADKLEHEQKDAQDIEFTVQDGKLYLLQTRNAKRSSVAAIRMAVEMVEEKLITPEEAMKRVKYEDFLRSFDPVIKPGFKTPPLYTGIPACSGIATGVVVKSAGAAINCKQPCILVTKETTPDDIAGMMAAKGVLTMTGGSTSHAAVVARAMNKPCVVGLGPEKMGEFPAGAKVSIDGATGRVWLTEVPVIEGGSSKELTKLTNLMANHAGCRLIGRENTPMVDLSGMSPDKAVEAVRKTLKSIKKGSVVVDLTDETHDVAILGFFGLASEADAMKRAQALHDSLTKAELGRCVFLTRTSLPGGMMAMKTLASVEDLLVCEDKSFVWTGPETKETKRVLGWMEKDGQTPVAIGRVTKNGFASQFQMAQGLLT